MVYFISDIHLGYYHGEPGRQHEAILLIFLESIRRDCKKLFILGDLFDYWFEYKTVIPRQFIRTIGLLLELRRQGIEIEYLIGNHDFGHESFFEKEIGIPVHAGDIERTIDGKRFYLSHGDGKLKNDRGYLVLRKILRNRTSMWLFRLLHPDCGIGLARSSSKKSRVHTQTKNYGTGEGMEEFAKSVIDKGFDYVIMGHRHKAKVVDFGIGKYINLGEWLENPTLGIFDGNDFELIPLIDYIKRRYA